METFARQRLESPDMIIGNLRATMEWPGKLTWRRRLVSLAMWPVMALVISLLVVVPTVSEVTGEIRNQIAGEIATTPASSMPVGATGNLEPWLAKAFSGQGAALAYWAGVLALLLFNGVLANFVWTFVTGLPPGLQLFGLVLTNREGKVSNRLMVLLRTFFTGVGMLTLVANLGFLALLAFGRPEMFFGKWAVIGLWSACAAVFLLLAGIAVHACLRPQRALVDLMLGTAIVPR
jgi:hypothetical protein